MPLFAKPLLGLVMIGAAPITVLLALRVKDDMDKPAMQWFYLMMLAGAGWALTNGIQTIFWSPTITIFADRLLLFTVSLTAITWFLFATEFANKQTVPDSIFWILLIVPLVTQFFVWTPQLDWLVYSAATVSNGQFSGTFGPWGTFDLWVFGYGLTFAAFAVLATEGLTADNRTRRIQVGLIIGGISVPVAISVANTLALTPIDLTVYGIAAAGIILLFTLRESSTSQLFSINQFAWDQAINDLDDPMFNFDSEHTLTDANPAARRVFDFEIGMEEDRLRDRNPELEPIFDESDPESIVTHVNGTRQHYSYQSSQVDYGRGATGQTVILRDITAQKRQEERLQRQNERLDEFASVVSHDLRNPLTVAEGRLELVREDVPADQFETIHRNLQRMEAIIGDVLTLARAGETVETPDSVLLAEVAREAWEHVDTPGASFDMQISEDVTVEADRNRLLTIFENLFRNAHDHNDPPLTVRTGTFRFEDRSTDRTDRTGSIGLYIEDDGGGIPSDRREEIFEHGYSTSDEGTGFGLSIVQDIVDAHGWEIRIADDGDPGTRFEIGGIQTNGL